MEQIFLNANMLNVNMLNVNIAKEIHGFEINAGWSAGGGITCLFGYTGSGKTLTLKMIAGLIAPDSGSIDFTDSVFFDSAKGIDLSPQRRNIGYVFQNNMLFPHMTIYQNILYGLSGRGNNKRGRVIDMVKIMRLESLEGKYPHQISGGQQQRAAIARALIKNPWLLLLDEPFNSLDHAVRIKMHRDLKHYQKFFNVPVILVTHDIDEMHSLADRVVLYNEGKVVQAGAPNDVFLMPGSRAAARLVGTKNILDGEVMKIDGGMAEVSTEKGVLTVQVGGKVKIGDKVICCIRPENISIMNSEMPPGKKVNVFTGTVVNIMQNAASYNLFLKIADSSYDFEIKVSSEDFTAMGLCNNKRVAIAIYPHKIHIIQGLGAKG